jgi:hypothetical protein
MVNRNKHLSFVIIRNKKWSRTISNGFSNEIAKYKHYFLNCR